MQLRMVGLSGKQISLAEGSLGQGSQNYFITDILANSANKQFTFNHVSTKSRKFSTCECWTAVKA